LCSLLTFSSSFKHYNLKIYAIKNFEFFSIYSHTNVRLDPMVEVLKKDLFSFALLWSP
jgi:hypothetical protein